MSSLITPEEFAEQYTQMYLLLEEVYEDDPQGTPSLFYGYGDGGQFGWWQVVPDYSVWFNHFMGATFEDALKEVQEQYDEWKEDMEDDE